MVKITLRSTANKVTVKESAREKFEITQERRKGGARSLQYCLPSAQKHNKLARTFLTYSQLYCSPKEKKH